MCTTNPSPLMLEKIKISFGRLLDGIEFHFVGGHTESYGDIDAGEDSAIFDIFTEQNEYIVRIKTKQGKHLDGLQFITNHGRVSRWYGGGGGEPVSFTADAEAMVSGLVFDDSNFCPKLLGIRERLAPKLRKVSMRWLMTNKSTRDLTFKGKPSLFKLARKGSPSVVKLVFKGSPSVMKLMFKGKPCVLRLLLTGEEMENREHRFSLFRILCSEKTFLSIPGTSIQNVMLDSGSPDLEPIIKLFLRDYKVKMLGKKTKRVDGIFKQMLKSGLARKFLEDDQVVGLPSVLKLLIQNQDEIHDDNERRQLVRHNPCLLELMCFQEQKTDAFAEMSILRMMLLKDADVVGKEESVFELMMLKTHPDRKSLMELCLDNDEEGFNVCRKLMTPNSGPRGFSPSLLHFLLQQELLDRPNSILRLLIGGEHPSKNGQKSIFRIFLTQFKENTTPLLQMMFLGRPSIVDLFFDGELSSDESLARLFMSLRIRVDDGQLKFEVDHNNERNSTEELSFLGFLLMGEERGGPGMSFLRILTMGEEKNSMSLLRLLLLNEGEDAENGLTSLMRISLISMKAFLLSYRQRKTDISQWRSNFESMKNLILSSHPGFKNNSLTETLQTLAQSVKQGLSKYGEVIEILKTIPARGKEFENLWRNSCFAVASEMSKIKERVDDESVWIEVAPLLEKMLRNLGEQKWHKVIANIPALLVALTSLVQQYFSIDNSLI